MQLPKSTTLESFSPGLTPELSRTALRPWASETQWYLHKAAKRGRLERIVRPKLIAAYLMAIYIGAVNAAPIEFPNK